MIDQELEELLDRQKYELDEKSTFENDHNPSVMLWTEPPGESIAHQYQLLVLINKVQYTALLTEDDFYLFLNLVNDDANDKLPLFYIRVCEWRYLEWHFDADTSQRVYDLISHKFMVDKMAGFHEEDEDD